MKTNLAVRHLLLALLFAAPILASAQPAPGTGWLTTPPDQARHLDGTLMSTDTRPFSVSEARPEPARFVTHQDSPLFSTQVEIPQADGIITHSPGNPDPVICESLDDPRCGGGGGGNPTPTPGVPEPATWLGGALVSGLAVWGMRRCFRAGSVG